MRNEGLNNLYFSPGVPGVIISRTRRWAGHMTHMKEIRVHKKLWPLSLKGNVRFGEVGINERIILQCIMERYVRV